MTPSANNIIDINFVFFFINLTTQIKAINRNHSIPEKWKLNIRPAKTPVASQKICLFFVIAFQKKIQERY